MEAALYTSQEDEGGRLMGCTAIKRCCLFGLSDPKGVKINQAQPLKNCNNGTSSSRGADELCKPAEMSPPPPAGVCRGSAGQRAAAHDVGASIFKMIHARSVCSAR
jgi:hypothetical protein